MVVEFVEMPWEIAGVYQENSESCVESTSLHPTPCTKVHLIFHGLGIFVKVNKIYYLKWEKVYLN